MKQTIFTKVFAVLFLVFAYTATFAQGDSIYRLPAGTEITVRMDTEISSGVNAKGDTFTVRISKPVKVRDVVVVSEGTKLEGRIIDVTKRGIGNRNGRLKITFETMYLSETECRDIEATPKELSIGKSNAIFNVLSVVAGTGIGLAAGIAAKGKSGALVGAGIGASAGTGVAMLKKGADAKIEGGEEFVIVLNSDLNLPVDDY